MTAHNCDEALQNLYVYLDRELDSATTEGIHAHLEECGECYRGFDFEHRLKQVVRDRLAEDVPPQFLEKLRTALRDEATSR